MLSAHLEDRLQQFEARWGTAEEISFDEILDEVAAEERAECLAELLLMIDLEFRLCRVADRPESGDVVSQQLSRFPELQRHPLLQAKIRQHWNSLVQGLRRIPEDTTLAVSAEMTDPINRSTMDLRPPCRFGQFRLSRSIGAGGMGAVFEAQQSDPQRLVAIKVLHAAALTDSQAVHRCDREIQIISSIHGLCERPNQNLIAAGGRDGTIRILELLSLTFRQTLLAEDLTVESVCFDSEREWLIAASESGSLTCWRMQNGSIELLFRIDLKLGPLSKVLWLQRTRSLAVLVSGESAVRLIALDQVVSALAEMNLLPSD